MVDDEILTRSYEVTPESLWTAVKKALENTEGVVVKKVEENYVGLPSPPVSPGPVGAKICSPVLKRARREVQC
jgi:hypothetical protein